MVSSSLDCEIKFYFIAKLNLNYMKCKLTRNAKGEEYSTMSLLDRSMGINSKSMYVSPKH